MNHRIGGCGTAVHHQDRRLDSSSTEFDSFAGRRDRQIIGTGLLKDPGNFNTSTAISPGFDHHHATNPRLIEGTKDAIIVPNGFQIDFQNGLMPLYQ